MKETQEKEFYQVAFRLYPLGPSQSNIWKRSGGDVSFLYLNQSGRDAWYEALERLFNGGGGKITRQRLLVEMLAEFPEDSDLIRLQKDHLSANRLIADETSPASPDEMEYRAEEQSWFVKDFPETKNIPSKELSNFVSATEIIIFTVTDIELKYALSFLQPAESRSHILKGVKGSETYYIGKFGAFNAVVTKCQMGTTGIGAATLASEEGLRFWQPSAAFMVGIAFGKDSSKQHLGQVLIANSVIPYESQRVGNSVISRGIPIPSDAILLNRFEHSYDWRFLLPNGQDCKKEFGPILSGEKLVDDLDYKNELFQRHPNAVGGEMEGAGFYAAAQRKRIPCLLLKSICDWGDGQKHKKHQSLAAATVSSLLFKILSQTDALNFNQSPGEIILENSSPDSVPSIDKKN